MIRSILIGLFALLLAITLLFNLRMEQPRSSATISIEAPPYSADPIEYDSAPHHVAFRSVHSSIVSQYKAGKIEPTLVESWSSSQDYRNWQFIVRGGMQFENNDPLRAVDIVNSWLRVAHIMKKNRSKSGFFEHLKGFDHWEGLGTELDGLKVRGNTIELTFTSPFRDLLNTISFGLYAVVHPSCYDHSDGHWINSKCSISSGPYKISHWRDDELELVLREDLATQAGSKPIKSFKILWDRKKRSTADLIMGFSIEDSYSNDRIFFGTPTANFAYVRCHSWSDSNSPCGSVEKRRKLRAAFFLELSKLQDLPDLTLFPMSIPGISNFRAENYTFAKTPEFKLKFRPSRLEQKPFQSFNVSAMQIVQHLGGTSESVAISYDEMFKEMDSPLKKYSVDLSAEYSGLLIEAPKEDIRFMFMSKEGIRLPDTDGRIANELKKPDFDPQVINELIWDQAAIWPLAHFSLGFWAKKDLFDFSLLNLSLPPTDLQYIRWK